jgi:hypothetical protein
MEFNLMKKFSGPYPDGYTADLFTFDIVGTSASGTAVSKTDIALSAYTDDTATAVVDLPMGEYTITENGPDGFVQDEWVVQWSDSSGCIQQSGLSTTIIIDDDPEGMDNFGLANVGCRADNQWFPDDGEPEPEPETGTLVVNKVIVGTTTAATSSFSFTYTGAGGNTAFESDGTNVLLNMATGTYTITESPTPSGYAVSYNNCANVLITANATTTCTITNRYSPGNGETGTLVVRKIVINDNGGSTATSSFSFTYTGATGTTAFESDGSNELSVATGTYTITESPASSGYIVSYDNCSNVTVSAGTTTTCTITNNDIGGSSGDICPLGDNLILNGGFESNTVTDGAGWDIFASGTSGLEWLVSWVSAFAGAPATANIELHGGVNGWLASEGDQYAELDSDWGGPSSAQTGEEASTRIVQTITTVPGSTYELEFDFSPRPDTATSDNELLVYIGGVLEDTLTADGSGNGNTAWTSHTYSFVATSTTTQIAFADGGTPNAEGTLIDNTALCLISNGGNGGDDDDGGSSSNGGGGNGKKIELSSGGGRSNDNDGGDDDDNGPIPQVLGESTVAFPAGAPDTGKGGASRNFSESNGILGARIERTEEEETA